MQTPDTAFLTFYSVLFWWGDILAGAREMEQQLKWLPHQQEVSSLILRSYVKCWMGMPVNL